jgi:hypothetical protein
MFTPESKLEDKFLETEIFSELKDNENICICEKKVTLFMVKGNGYPWQRKVC